MERRAGHPARSAPVPSRANAGVGLSGPADRVPDPPGLRLHDDSPELEWARLAVWNAHRAGRAGTSERLPAHALRDRPTHPPTAVQRPGLPAAAAPRSVGGRGRGPPGHSDLRPHAERGDQPRLRPGRAGPGDPQPEQPGAVLSREASVLQPGPGAVPAGGSGVPGTAPTPAALLQ